MTIGSNKKYGIILIVALSLFILGALALYDSSKDDVKLSNNADEPTNNSSVEEPITSSMSASLPAFNHTELSDRSEMILIGTVKEILPSKWTSADGRRPNGIDSFSLENSIYTDITINVEKYLKNPSSSQEITVRIDGGTVGNDTLEADYEPTFKPGEKVLLFLTEDVVVGTNNIEPKHLTVTGCMVGKYTLTEDGKATRLGENTTLEELLNTIENSNNTVEQPNHPEATSTDEPANNIGVEEPITGSISGSLVALNHTELNDLSDTIVMGTVKETLPSKWNTADGKRPSTTDKAFSPSCLIYTDVVITIDEYRKNPLPSKEVTVRLWGGAVGNDTLTVENEPSFETGEKVLLYLMKDSSPSTKDIGPEHFRVTGALQGKYTLTDDGKATRPDESITLGELLNTIKE